MKSALATAALGRRRQEHTRAADHLRDAFARGGAGLLVDRLGAVLAFPAATATTAQLHFATRHSAGLIHVAMPSARLDELRIPDQSVLPAEDSGLSYTVAVDAATGIGTGISASDRARTVRVLADPRSAAHDLVRPGHILPIRCADGGFAERDRIWELACDLVRDSGLAPVAVVCRLTNDEGDLVDGAAEAFAGAHRLPVLRVLP
ncbi:3,4-dihydroxy-2-butanone-4-phosphate synthase [Mycobacterium palustre]|uniref:3,4-dihydroxy-2-butanone-4-phosphate synthase n=1 Tax=Mycobacterium palustre TaxID=153971 RepID=UPI000A14FDA8|nr:3,4-dihydroxy-2-butanone-4-phosphate synthase [Mycobacterium palustre]MCV7103524.1 3,4-dihydroxy-2-butanone-4-phosphate synthase [Mycobacterium palustre]